MPAINGLPIATPGVSYLIYPSTLLFTVFLYTFWSAAADNTAISAFGSVVVGLSVITIFEYFMPHRQKWRPQKFDLIHDLIYVTLIQVLLPRFLGLLVAIMLAEQVGDKAPLASLWPHEWPVVAQVILLIVAADFMRYWLHRLSHTYPLLWRLHAVHHSVERLYWLNTSRFHPIEKTLQFFLDTLPFILMGVDTRIIGFWFVVYSVNGFFQHSNIQLQFSWLSNIFSTAEMHRWHHSRKPGESNNNYANVFILWDRLFGTFFRPTQREVEELGLLNRSYPMSFLAQMKAPFIANLDQQPVPMPKMRDVLLNLMLKSRMLRTRLTHWKKLTKAARNPERTQLDVLKDILQKNANTEYGKLYGFHRIDSYKTFCANIPIVGYEELRPYIEKQRQTSSAELTSESPLIYNTTSGTTGQPKYIPILRKEIQAQRRHGLLMTYCQYVFDPVAFDGKIWAIASPAIEGRFENGTPWGSASGLLYANMSWRVASKYVMPAEVFEIEDHDLKYHTMLRLAVAERGITYLTCANPSTILKLSSMLKTRWENIVRDIEQGTFERLHELPPHIASAISTRLGRDPARAHELERIFSAEREAALSEVWPQLRMISTWTNGNCAVPLSRVRQLFSSSNQIVELGYLSSEFRGTLTINLETGTGLPNIEDYFLEFIEPEKWESGNRDFRMIHQLENGRDYYVVVTTPSGLYRYFINDIVRATGHYLNTPTLHFLQKGKGVTNITGEKLYEDQVLQAVRLASEHFSLKTTFFLMCANVEDQKYHLFLELGEAGIPTNHVLSTFIDEALANLNIEYATKRRSGRLKSLDLNLLQPGSGEAYRSFCVSSGQKDAQFKPVTLQYLNECLFNFDT